jgi:hypothetical protein
MGWPFCIGIWPQVSGAALQRHLRTACASELAMWMLRSYQEDTACPSGAGLRLGGWGEIGLNRFYFSEVFLSSNGC